MLCVFVSECVPFRNYIHFVVDRLHKPSPKPFNTNTGVQPHEFFVSWAITTLLILLEFSTIDPTTVASWLDTHIYINNLAFFVYNSFLTV